MLFFILYIKVRSYVFFFCFKQKTAYELRISDWSSDVCSSDLLTTDELRLPLLSECIDGLGMILGPARQHLIGEADVDHRCEHQIGRASCRERVCQYV